MSTALLALFAVILCILFRILNVNSAPQRPHLVCKDQSFLSTVLKIAPVIAEPMPDHDRRKRSRSRSKDDHRHRHKQRREQKFTNMQNQLDNLRKAIETLVQVQKEQRPANQSTEIETDNIEIIATTNVEEKKDLNTEVIGGSIQEKQSSKDISEEPTLRDNVLKVLGVDLNESKFKDVKYHPELKNTWSKWMKQGLPEKNKKEIIELYNRKGDLYTEAPKINLEIVPLLSEMAKKRDEHFLETQNCVGTALAALGAAISMLIDSPEEGLDEDVFTDYLSHAGQILTDVFHQQSVVRKSFITPQLNKNIKPTVDAMISDEWLYGNNLKEKVKDAKEIEKACAEIKDKAQQKNSSKSNRGNSKYPPANYRQVGYQQKHRQFRFKKRISQNLTQSLFKRNSDEPIVIQEISQVDKTAGRLRFFVDRYKPTRLWGFSGHVQTIVHSVIGRVRCPWPIGERVYIGLPDGTTLTYDLYQPLTNGHEDDITIAICPGIGNSSESVYIRTFVHFVQCHGYRCAVLNHVGALSSVKITAPRIFSYGHTDDYSAMLQHLVEQHPNTRIVCIGYSLGGNLVTKYLGERGSNKLPNIIGGISICQGYNALKGTKILLNWQNFRRFYLYVMTESMKNLILKHKNMLLSEDVKQRCNLNERDIISAATLPELDEAYTRRVHNFRTVQELYKWSSCVFYLDNITTPMVFINALDDPIVPEVLLKPIKEHAANNLNTLYVEIAHGGHLGFYEGGFLYPNPITWLDRTLVSLVGSLTLAHADKALKAS